MRVCVVGSCNMDLAASCERLPGPGETVLGTDLLTSVGGKGFNQAVAAARLGAEVAMVGRVGADLYGDELLRAMAGDGIDARCVTVDPERGTGVAVIHLDAAGQNAIVAVPRANGLVSPADVERAAAVIEAAAVVLLQLELPLDAVAAAARMARRAGALVILNPAPAACTADDLRGLADVLVPNESEAAALIGAAAPDAHAVRAATDSPVCVLTMEERGVVVADADGTTQSLAAHSIDCVDSVGAGDAFCGALAARLAAGDPLERAVAYANAAGALAVTKPGGAPAMPRLPAVTALLA